MSVTSRTRYWAEVNKTLESDWGASEWLRDELIARYSTEIREDFESGAERSGVTVLHETQR